MQRAALGHARRSDGAASVWVRGFATSEGASGVHGPGGPPAAVQVPVPKKGRSTFKGVDILESEEDFEGTPRMGVVGFGPTTFQVNDVLVRQSTLLLPTSYFLWSAHNVEDITVDSLSIFLTVHPRLEIIFVGTGRHLQAVPKHVVDHYRERGIVIEVSPPPVSACPCLSLLACACSMGCSLRPAPPLRLILTATSPILSPTPLSSSARDR